MINRVGDDMVKLVVGGEAIGGTIIWAQVDSGSAVNTLTEIQFRGMRWDIASGATRIFAYNEDKSRVLKAYASDKPMEVIATFKAKVKGEQDWKPEVEATFFVVENASGALLGRKTAMDLRLLEVGLRVNRVQEVKEFPAITLPPVKFDVDDSVVTKQRSYQRIPVALEKPVQERLDEMERMGIIERAPRAPKYLAPMEVVPKGKTDFRIVIDMREANKAIKRVPYPMPTLENFKTKLNGATRFSKLDLKSAYFHVRIHEDSMPLTTFMTRKGPMRYRRLMFGVSAAPEIFQKIMEEVLSGCEGTLVYLDDILIFANGDDLLKERTEAVKKRLKDVNLTINPEKCEYGKEKVEFLGFTVGESGIVPTESKKKAVSEFRQPKCKTELQQFLGLVTFVGGFIEDLATKTAPLRKLTQKEAQWSWEDEHENAFQHLKSVVGTALTEQGYFKLGCETKLYTDASPEGLGAVLVQVQDGKDTTIAIISKSLTETEKRYPQPHREALAVVWAIERSHFYLLGNPFTLFTDNRALQFLFGGKFRDGKRAMTRAESWALRLSHYVFDIVHVPGKENVADTPSRLMTAVDKPFSEREDGEEAATTVTLQLHAVVEGIQALSLRLVIKESQADEEIQAVSQAIKTGGWPDHLKLYQALKDELIVDREGILLRDTRIVVPRTLQAKAVEIAHLGHAGTNSMKRMLRERVWWPSMSKDVEKYCNTCLACVAMQKDDKPAPMNSTELPQYPWEYISVDHYSAGKISDKVLVVIDYYSRFVQAIPVTSTSAECTTRALQRVFDLTGYPSRLRADNGPPYDSAEFEKWCQNRGIKLINSTPLDPEQNGLVESQMRGLTRALKAAFIELKNWRSELQTYVRAYNDRPQATTKKSPREVMLGRVLQGPLPTTEVRVRNHDDDDMRDTDALAKLKSKQYTDERRKAKPNTLSVGDKVMMHAMKTNKLAPNFDPTPFEITEQADKFVIIEGPEGQRYKRNPTQLKKWPEQRENVEQEVEVEVRKEEVSREKKEAVDRQHLRRNVKKPAKFTNLVEEICCDDEE